MENFFSEIEGVIREPAMNRSAGEGNVDEVRNLLRSGHDGTEVDYFRCNSLHKAVDEDRKDVVALLVERPELVNAIDLFHQTPIFYARDEVMLRILKAAKSNFAARDIHGHVCAYYFSRGAFSKDALLDGRLERAQYAIKMTVLDIFDDLRSSDVLESLNNSQIEIPVLQNKKANKYLGKCLQEIKQMAERVPNRDYTFYDILKNPEGHVRSLRVAGALEESGYEARFPIYGSELKLVCTRARSRAHDVDNAVDLFRSGIGNRIDRESLYRICKYLDAPSIARLTEACRRTDNQLDSNLNPYPAGAVAYHGYSDSQCASNYSPNHQVNNQPDSRLDGANVENFHRAGASRDK